jgi:hypothetical protein
MIDGTWRKSTKCGNAPDCAEVRWRKASRCGTEGACAEVAIDQDMIEIRNSSAPDAGTATFLRSEWAAFIGGVKDGEFDV